MLRDGVASHLDRDLRDARQRPAVRAGQRREIADHEDVRRARDREVRLDQHAAGAIERRRRAPRPSGDAATPAAHRTVSDAIVVDPDRARVPATRRSRSSWSAPRRRAAPDRAARPRAGLRERRSGSTARLRAAGSSREPGSKCRKSRASDCREISASAPAISTPVGPPPITTNVSSARPLRGSLSRSARSNASSTRRRISSASSSVFSPGATRRHSSWPKYACVAPVATIRKS